MMQDRSMIADDRSRVGEPVRGGRRSFGWQTAAVRSLDARWRRSSEITPRPARGSGSCVRACRRRLRPALADRLERLHARLADGALDRVSCRCSRRPTACGAGSRPPRAGATLRTGSPRAVYASDVIVALAAEGELDAADTRVAASGARRRSATSPSPSRRSISSCAAVASPTLLELPPVVAAEIQLRLLLHLDIATEASLWRRVGGAQVECVVSLGADAGSRRVRATAKAAITGRGGLSLIGAPRPCCGSPRCDGSASRPARS